MLYIVNCWRTYSISDILVLLLFSCYWANSRPTSNTPQTIDKIWHRPHIGIINQPLLQTFKESITEVHWQYSMWNSGTRDYVKLERKHFEDISLNWSMSFHYGYCQGYFCDGTCHNAVSVLLSQDANQNGVPEPFFPGTGIANPHLWPHLGHSVKF
jgi:hypothetical protein